MQQKSGQILFCGITNAGKSTLINQIAQYEFALVNFKPQTTRKTSRFWYQDDHYSVLFFDTPGYHVVKNKLDQFMNREIVKNYKRADCVFLLLDLSQPINSLTITFLKQVNLKARNKVVIVFTKQDLIPGAKLSTTINTKLEQISQYLSFQNYFSTWRDDPEVISKILRAATPLLLNQQIDCFGTTDNDDFLISETIRGCALKLFHQEIPHGIHIEVEEQKYQKNQNLFYIHAYIVCETESHKKIIIGHQGQAIKKLGIMARNKLLKIFDTKIYLDLKVKVWADWRNNERIVKKTMVQV